MSDPTAVPLKVVPPDAAPPSGASVLVVAAREVLRGLVESITDNNCLGQLRQIQGVAQDLSEAIAVLDPKLQAFEKARRRRHVRLARNSGFGDSMSMGDIAFGSSDDDKMLTVPAAQDQSNMASRMIEEAVGAMQLFIAYKEREATLRALTAAQKAGNDHLVDQLSARLGSLPGSNPSPEDDLNSSPPPAV